jgi:FtsP/CotA-like multicopper oxidase with cupredoxin domain
MTAEVETDEQSDPSDDRSSRLGRWAVMVYRIMISITVVLLFNQAVLAGQFMSGTIQSLEFHSAGGRTPPEHDGYPIDLVLPVGEDVPLPRMVEQFGDISIGTRAHWYPLEQPATAMWYHDHRMDFTGPGVWEGLAGFHIIRDEEEDALGLPSGTREMLLMILDRSFDADGSLLYPAIDPSALTTPGLNDGYDAGVLGDITLVNGVPWPITEVEGARYRLRCGAHGTSHAVRGG